MTHCFLADCAGEGEKRERACIFPNRQRGVTFAPHQLLPPRSARDPPRAAARASRPAFETSGNLDASAVRAHLIELTPPILRLSIWAASILYSFSSFVEKNVRFGIAASVIILKDINNYGHFWQGPGQGGAAAPPYPVASRSANQYDAQYSDFFGILRPRLADLFGESASASLIMRAINTTWQTKIDAPILRLSIWARQF